MNCVSPCNSWQLHSNAHVLVVHTRWRLMAVPPPPSLRSGSLARLSDFRPFWSSVSSAVILPVRSFRSLYIGSILFPPSGLESRKRVTTSCTTNRSEADRVSGGHLLSTKALKNCKYWPRANAQICSSRSRWSSKTLIVLCYGASWSYN